MSGVRSARWVVWTERVVAVGGILAVLWAGVTAGDAVVVGHPAYPVLLVAVLVGAVLVLVFAGRRPVRRKALRIVLAVLGFVVVALAVWVRPFPAGEVSREALVAGDGVAVTVMPTRIELIPDDAGPVGVLFQPGARVDARAYAAVLRPLAEAGYPVVIAQQPFGIGFLALGALDEARAAHPEVQSWVLAGHSLGGTVAALLADGADSGEPGSAGGLLLFASYPASDMRTSLGVPAASISGSQDGLSTPAKIEESRGLLPPSTVFTIIEGASHAQFGDYGPQPGDGIPTISDAAAREAISDAALTFLGGVTR